MIFSSIFSDPDQIGKITGFKIQQNATTTKVSWDEISIGECDVTYVVYASSDVGNFNIMTNTPSVEILSLYCFYLDVEVYAEINGIAGYPSVIKITYGELSSYFFLELVHSQSGKLIYFSFEGLSSIDDLEIITLVNENIFIITWTADINQEQCDIKYMVTYNYGTGSKSFNTSESSISFNIVNCAATTITVVTINGDKMSEGRSVKPKEC